MLDPITMGIIAGGAGLASGLINSGAQDRATQAATDASNKALALQEKQWNVAQQNQRPWLEAGGAALSDISARAAAGQNINASSDPGYRQVSGLTNPGDFQFNTTGANADPSYTWRLNQGLEGVNKSAAARGGFFSGQTGVDLMNYGQGAASQEYQNQFNRYNTGLQNYMNQENWNADQYNQAWNRQNSMDTTSYNRLAGIAGVGQTANEQLNNAGANYANNASNIAINQGNNMASNASNQGNIWGGVVNNATNQFMSAWGQQQQIDQLNNTPTNYNTEPLPDINALKYQWS